MNHLMLHTSQSQVYKVKQGYARLQERNACIMHVNNYLKPEALRFKQCSRVVRSRLVFQR
jgi:hypothetical protein